MVDRLEYGQKVTVHPRVDRSIGESLDTEPGLQPWVATYRGLGWDDNDYLVVTVQEAGRKEYRHLRVDTGIKLTPVES